MQNLLRKKVNISFAVNPFYMYCFAFSIAIMTYFLGWCDLYPEMSSGAIIFMSFSFLIFIIAGYLYEKRESSFSELPKISLSLGDLIFYFILLLGVIDILYMGYIPVIDRSHNYREFGMPVVDVLFNTLSVFFSLVFVQSYLESKKRRFILYQMILLVFQIILFRRSTIVLILSSIVYLHILQNKKVLLQIIIAGIIMIPLLSYSFGFFGNKRSDLNREKTIKTLGASRSFINSGISHNHYLSYLYISSPLANLQGNISSIDKFAGKGDLKGYVFYCIVPPSITMRLADKLKLTVPVHTLITPQLIVGSCYMLSYCTLGWIGMGFQMIFILIYVGMAIVLLRKWNTFYYISVSLLITTVTLLIFDNILIRLDFILMLFIYPLFFHFLNQRAISRSNWFKG